MFSSIEMLNGKFPIAVFEYRWVNIGDFASIEALADLNFKNWKQWSWPEMTIGASHFVTGW